MLATFETLSTSFHVSTQIQVSIQIYVSIQIHVSTRIHVSTQIHVAVYPLAAFWALLNNFLEMKSDGFKLCRVNQRPFSQSTSNIGAWQTAFEVLGVVGE